MKTSTRVLLWIVLLPCVVMALAAGYGYYLLRTTQPQMFADPVFDTVAPELPAAVAVANDAVLVYSKTSGGFRHGWSIDAANAMIARLAEANDWRVYYTENAAVFSDELLARFAVVVWNNATGAALSNAQRSSFQRWLEAGGGYVGLHAAGDGSHADWDWYTQQVIRARYNQHTLLPEHTPRARVTVEDNTHPATAHLPEQWSLEEEWYAWHDSPRTAGANILVTVDESTYTPWKATMGEDHPFVWHHTLGQGRVFYSAFGHWEETYSDPLLVPMMEQAIIWAGQLER